MVSGLSQCAALCGGSGGQVMDHHPRALGRERAADGRTDAARSPGHQHDLSGQSRVDHGPIMPGGR